MARGSLTFGQLLLSTLRHSSPSPFILPKGPYSIKAVKGRSDRAKYWVRKVACAQNVTAMSAILKLDGGKGKAMVLLL